jgi:hypothetical protein
MKLTWLPFSVRRAPVFDVWSVADTLYLRLWRVLLRWGPPIKADFIAGRDVDGEAFVRKDK